MHFLRSIVDCLLNLTGVEPNIKKLQSRIVDEQVLPQYTPPKWINPSEAWMLYYRAFKPSNLTSMIYKWASEWKLTIKDNWNNACVKFLHSIDKSVPKYELSYWNSFLWFRRKKVDFLWITMYQINDPKDLMFEGEYNIQSELLDYCIEKWWLKKTIKSKKKFSISPVVLFFPLFPIIMVPLIFISIFFFVTKRDELLCPWNIELTEKWKKLYAELLWYKYFLEHCDENKLQKLIEEDPDYIDKMLPYAVALRLNVDFLKYSRSSFSIASLDIDNSELYKN